MDDNTKQQLEFEEAVIQLREAVRIMRDGGADLSKKWQREALKDRFVDTMKRVVNDKRIFE